MTDQHAEAGPFTGRTAWTRNLAAPVREFFATETGGAAFLLAASVAALLWANIDVGELRPRLAHVPLDPARRRGITLDLREWVNAGLMTFFFFVVGLEARREFDIGELRERRRVTLPLLAGLGGMAVPVAIYLAFNAGSPAAHGWGTAMSTDTAFALGMLALVGPRFPDRLRSFILTVVVVDDLVALVIIATVYTDHLAVRAFARRRRGCSRRCSSCGPRTCGAGSSTPRSALAIWVAFLKSGIDPVVTGLVMGLLAYAYPAAREELERASSLFRLFREQPTAELARSARVGRRVGGVRRTSGCSRSTTRGRATRSCRCSRSRTSASRSAAASSRARSRRRSRSASCVGYVVGKPVGVTGTSRGS